MKFIPLYKQVYFVQRKKLKAILAKIENRITVIFPEPTREEMIRFLGDTRQYDDYLGGLYAGYALVMMELVNKK